MLCLSGEVRSSTLKMTARSRLNRLSVTEDKVQSPFVRNTIVEVDCIDGKTIEISLQVEEAIVLYDIIATTSEGGIISPSSAKVEKGETKTFKIIPEVEYEIEDVLVNGVSIGKVTEYTFVNVDENQTIQAVFK